MSQSVSLSIVTNSLITCSKVFGWWITGSPTLFAESIHSAADVANQVLLKVGEVRAQGEADASHPFGRGQERFFWALVSAVSVFFVGCGVTVYHGVESLLHPGELEPFTPLAVGLLLFSLALEGYTFRIAWREIGGWRGAMESRYNTTVLAVLLEDTVALLGIALALAVAAVSFLWGPKAALDAAIAIVVGLMLGTMAVFLANINRTMLIDVADTGLNRELASLLGSHRVRAEVSSLTVDVDRYVVFVSVDPHSAEIVRGRSWELGGAIKEHGAHRLKKRIDAVYWRFPAGSAA